MQIGGLIPGARHLGQLEVQPQGEYCGQRLEDVLVAIHQGVACRPHQHKEGGTGTASADKQESKQGYKFRLYRKRTFVLDDVPLERHPGSRRRGLAALLVVVAQGKIAWMESHSKKTSQVTQHVTSTDTSKQVAACCITSTSIKRDTLYICGYRQT